MIDKIKLWEKDVPHFKSEYGQEAPDITPYLLKDGKVHPCVIVFPGGGYTERAYHEGEPVAKWLNSIGIHAFVLAYRVVPYTYPAILGDALRAVRVVRSRADAFKISPNKIGVLGFSSGGHLAAMTALRHDLAELSSTDPIDAVSSRPDAAILCYPVLSFEQYIHEGSRMRFLGDEQNWESYHAFSAEAIVTPDAPPMFIWHTGEDRGVLPENSINMAMALRKNRVPFAFHLYPEGEHGLGLAENVPRTSMWTDDCRAWLSETFEMEAQG